MSDSIDKFFPFKRAGKKLILESPGIFKIYEEAVTDNNGETKKWYQIDGGSGVAILPIDGEYVYLIKEYRYASDKVMWTLPSGGTDPQKPPLESAKSELREELGATAKKWHSLGSFDPSPGTAKNTAYMYLATDLTFTDQQLEPTEIIEVKKFLFDDALQMVWDNHIENAWAIIPILKAAHYLNQKHL